MFEAGVQYGHKNKFDNPAMRPYVHQTKNGMRIIDVVQSADGLIKALEFVKSIAKDGKQILFVGTKNKVSPLVKRYAESCNMPSVDARWYGGTLTNHMVVRQSVKRLEALHLQERENDFAHLIKKERAKQIHSITKLLKKVGGMRIMRGLPSALFIVDVRAETNAVREANALGIPVIGIVDTNSSPIGIDYIIPGNDDSTKAINLYLSSISDAVNEVRHASVKIDEAGAVGTDANEPVAQVGKTKGN